MEFDKILNLEDYKKEYKQPEGFRITCCFTTLSEASYFGIKDATVYPMWESHYKENYKPKETVKDKTKKTRGKK